MKVLFDNNRKFEQKIFKFLAYRKKKIQFNSVSVSKIIEDVKKNGLYMMLEYMKVIIIKDSKTLRLILTLI